MPNLYGPDEIPIALPAEAADLPGALLAAVTVIDRVRAGQVVADLDDVMVEPHRNELLHTLKHDRSGAGACGKFVAAIDRHALMRRVDGQLTVVFLRQL